MKKKLLQGKQERRPLFCRPGGLPAQHSEPRRARRLITRAVLCVFCASCLTLAPGSLMANRPGEAASRFKEILPLLGAGKYTQAVARLQELIEAHPDFQPAYRTLYDTYFYLDQLDAAEAYFTTLLSSGTHRPFALYGLARICFRRKAHAQAISYLKAAILAAPAFTDAYGHQGGLPEVCKAAGKLDEAAQFFAAQLREKPGDIFGQFGLARTYLRAYKWQEALQLLRRIVRERPQFLPAYHSLSFLYYCTGDFDLSRQAARKLEELAVGRDNPEMHAFAVYMLGNLAITRGDYATALDHLMKALEIAHATGDLRREAACRNSIASIYALSGNLRKALAHFRRALALAQRTGTQAMVLNTRLNIGNIYKELEDFSQALHFYEQAHELVRTLDNPHRESLLLTNIAEVHLKTGKRAKARTLLARALVLCRQVGDAALEGYILTRLSEIEHQQKQYRAALDRLTKARAIGRKTGDAQILWETFARLGAVYEDLRAFDAAVSNYKRAVAQYDAARKSLDISSLSSDFLEDKYEVYPALIARLAARGDLDGAFAYAEKYRAKALAQIFARKARTEDGAAGDSLRAAFRRSAATLDSLHTLYSRAKLAHAAAPRLLDLEQRITRLDIAKNKTLKALARKNSLYSSLARNTTISVSALQRSVLQRDESLIQYIVGPEALIIFVVTRDTLACLRQAIGRKALKNMLSRVSHLFHNPTGASGEAGLKFVNPDLADFSITAAHALYQKLVAPVLPMLPAQTALVIVPDDILHYLPFEMLVTDTTGMHNRYDFAHAQFLMQAYAVSYATSATLLGSSRRLHPKPTRGVLALGDPRTTTPRRPGGMTGLILAFFSRLTGPATENPYALPHSAEEARIAGRSFAEADNLVLTGPRATEQQFRSRAGEYGILHIATHFLVDDYQPLYSKLVLAPAANSAEDGYLQTYEVPQLRLSAELVVLSGCNTGLGKLRRGEGVMGISRAFQEAGAPSLVASLWSVDDQSTAEIMRLFYDGLRAGQDERQALRAAKQRFLQKAGPEKQDPFFWAPFVLIGDSRPVTLPGRSRASHAGLLLLFLLILPAVPALLRFRRRLRGAARDDASNA